MLRAGEPPAVHHRDRLTEAGMERVVNDHLTRQTPGIVTLSRPARGKSWLACALGHKACRDDRSVLYCRVPRLLDALALARGDGRHARLLEEPRTRASC